MKLLYITNARIPTDKANGIQIVKMCEAFQRQDLEVELWLPTRAQDPEKEPVENIWTYYDVDTPFQVTHVYAPDFIRFWKLLPTKMLGLLYQFQSLLFALHAFFRTMRMPQIIYYTRSIHVMLVLCCTKALHQKKIYFEAHELHGDPETTGLFRQVFFRIMRWMLRRVDGVIVITQRLQELYAKFGLDERQILVAADGIDQKRLDFSLDRSTARHRLRLPQDQTIICYTGHLFRWKGVYTLAESGKYLPKECGIYIIGGTKADVDALQHAIVAWALNNVVLTGYVPYHKVAHYLCAADVLVLPNSAVERISREYTSPLKLFEYMAARRPIVASDLPSLREVLRHQKNACLVHPDDPQTLARGILQVMRSKTLSEQLVSAAYDDVQTYTWAQRAKRICSFIETT